MNKKVKRLTLLLVTLALTATAILAGLGGKANAAGISSITVAGYNKVLNYGMWGSTDNFWLTGNDGVTYKGTCTYPKRGTPPKGTKFDVISAKQLIDSISGSIPIPGRPEDSWNEGHRKYSVRAMAVGAYYSTLNLDQVNKDPLMKQRYDQLWHFWDEFPYGDNQYEKRALGVHLESSVFQVMTYPGFDFSSTFGMAPDAKAFWDKYYDDFNSPGETELRNLTVHITDNEPETLEKILRSVYFANLDLAGGNQSMMLVVPTKYGHLNLSKVSSMVNYTDQNPGYSLNGAEYGVFSDAGANNRVGTLTTDANGVSNTIELEVGDYWVKEVKAPTGFHLDSKIHKVTVDEG